MSYDLELREEELKNKIAEDYFKNFDSTQIIEQIDFCIARKIQTSQHFDKQKTFDDKEFETEYYLWAEAKKGKNRDIYESFIQLILTIGKSRIFDKHLPPAFLGAFDAQKIAFLPYYKIMDVLSQSDFNWNVAPSNHNTKEFKQLYQLVKETLEAESFIYKFGSDDKEIKDFISNNFGKSDGNISKVQIDKNNFVNIYSKWLYSVKNSISVDWDKAKRSGIIDADFYLADLLSENNLTLIKKLFVILKSDHYELERNIDKMGFLISKTAHFYDKQKSHKEFWKRYQRPPKEEYWDYIINRRDLLVPPDIRSRKGSFFTPQIWDEKSREYLASIIEQNFDDKGIIFPISVAPYEVVIIAVDKEGENSFNKAIEIYNSLNSIGIETLFDDRNLRLGVKLNDCDLIGIPMRIIIGKKSLEKGIVEFKLRNSAQSEEIKIDYIVEYVKNKKEELFNEINK